MSSRRPEIVLPEAELQQRLKRMTRRGFLVGGVAAAAGIGAYEYMLHSEKVDDMSWMQRRVLDFNGRLGERYVSNSHLMPTYQPSDIGYLKQNGDYGLDDPIDIDAWRLRFESAPGATPLTLTLTDVQSLPKVEMITRLCCIEGWSVVTHWGGVRFSDFTKKYFPPGRAVPRYVYMATPGEDYYVGLDTKSALHPQTLLAWELNGKPLESGHGAPLRLVIPVKYGIKNIKRLALIRFTDERPGDYWGEEGYDWFAGL